MDISLALDPKFHASQIYEIIALQLMRALRSLLLAMIFQLHFCDSGELAQPNAICPGESSNASDFFHFLIPVLPARLMSFRSGWLHPSDTIGQFSVRPYGAMVQTVTGFRTTRPSLNGY